MTVEKAMSKAVVASNSNRIRLHNKVTHVITGIAKRAGYNAILEPTMHIRTAAAPTDGSASPAGLEGTTILTTSTSGTRERTRRGDALFINKRTAQEPDGPSPPSQEVIRKAQEWAAKALPVSEGGIPEEEAEKRRDKATSHVMNLMRAEIMMDTRGTDVYAKTAMDVHKSHENGTRAVAAGENQKRKKYSPSELQFDLRKDFHCSFYPAGFSYLGVLGPWTRGLLHHLTRNYVQKTHKGNHKKGKVKGARWLRYAQHRLSTSIINKALEIYQVWEMVHNKDGGDGDHRPPGVAAGGAEAAPVAPHA
jgi:hypothetical protein